MNDLSLFELMSGIFFEIWSLFSVDHPLLHISFADIMLGVFVVNLSIIILRPLLGIGTSAGRSLIRSAGKDRDKH